MRRFALAAGAVLVAVLLVPAAGGAQSVIGSPDIAVVAPDNRVTPGQEVGFELTLSNAGRIEQGGPAQHETRVKTARATTVELRSGDAPVTVKTDAVPAGSVPEGTVGPLTFRVAVSDDADAGRYRLPVDISYTYTRAVEYGPGLEPEYHDGTRTERAYVTLVVEDRARFRVVDTETTAQVGESGNLTVRLANVGNEPARDASVMLTSRGDAVTVGSAPGGSAGYVGDWRPGEEEDVTFGIAVSEGAEARGFTLDAEVAFDDIEGVRRASRRLPVGVRPGGEQSFALRNVTGRLAVGDEARVEGEVVNLGPETAEDPAVTLAPENPSITVTESEYALPDLAVGEAAAFAFDVDVSDDASEGFRRLPFRVSYDDADGNTQVADRLTHRFRVAGERDDFLVRAQENTVPAGGSGTLELAVTNNRDEAVTDVSAKAFVDDPLSSGDDEGFVARLEPNETAEITLGLGVAGSALAKTYPVSIDFQYTDSDGDTRLSDTYKVPVDVAEGGGGGPPIGPVAVLVLIGGGLVYWFRFR